MLDMMQAPQAICNFSLSIRPSVYDRAGSVISEIDECCPQHSVFLELVNEAGKWTWTLVWQLDKASLHLFLHNLFVVECRGLSGNCELENCYCVGFHNEENWRDADRRASFSGKVVTLVFTHRLHTQTACESNLLNLLLTSRLALSDLHEGAIYWVSMPRYPNAITRISGIHFTHVDK